MMAYLVQVCSYECCFKQFNGQRPRKLFEIPSAAEDEENEKAVALTSSTKWKTSGWLEETVPQHQRKRRDIVRKTIQRLRVSCRKKTHSSITLNMTEE